jgi:hypothetical protein
MKSNEELLTILPDKMQQFATEIVDLVWQLDIDYIDAVVMWCERNNLEVEIAASFIQNNPMIMSEIRIEAENLNILKKTAMLPF